jgi:hypothetical protein
VSRIQDKGQGGQEKHLRKGRKYGIKRGVIKLRWVCKSFFVPMVEGFQLTAYFYLQEEYCYEIVF